MKYILILTMLYSCGYAEEKTIEFTKDKARSLESYCEEMAINIIEKQEKEINNCIDEAKKEDEHYRKITTKKGLTPDDFSKAGFYRNPKNEKICRMMYEKASEMSLTYICMARGGN